MMRHATKKRFGFLVAGVNAVIRSGWRQGERLRRKSEFAPMTPPASYVTEGHRHQTNPCLGFLTDEIVFW